jgi:hypothetical protein
MSRALLALFAAALMMGCGTSPEPEAKKEDFSKRPMPQGYHGPEGPPPAANPGAG